MSLATPEIILTIAAYPWDVQVAVNINIAGQIRPAALGEVEVLLENIGELFDFKIYHTTGWRPIGADGKITFSSINYDWIGGFSGIAGPNRFLLHARLTTENVWRNILLYLAETSWSWEPWQHYPPP